MKIRNFITEGCGRAAMICFLTIGLVGQAQAVTMGGDYEEFLTLQTDAYLGYWKDSEKFFTLNKGQENWNQPTPVSNVSFVDEALDDFTFGEVYAMGTTRNHWFDTFLNTGVVSVFDDEGEVLFTAEYESGGDFESIWKNGQAGELAFSGLFTVTGGEFYERGLLDGTIYIDAAYHTVTGLYSRDIIAQYGTYRFFSPDGIPIIDPPTDVPEPMSLSLLAAGLLGGAWRRKNQVSLQ